MAVRLLSPLDQTEPQRRGNGTSVMVSPAEMAARFADHPAAVAETARIAERIEFDLTRDLGYRYPGSEDPEADRKLAELCGARLYERYPHNGENGEAARAAGGGAARDPQARPVGLLPAPPRHARAGARGRGRGARRQRGAPPAAARARARLERQLDRLLPHRPLAHRPDPQQAAARALPARGDHVAARHRPRLPARHPRAADPARARPLRHRARRARGGVRDLPLEGRDPRPRQGARPARRRDRARRALGRRVRGRRRLPPRRGGGDRRAARRLGALARADRARARRPTGCRATPPSTRAGW